MGPAGRMFNFLRPQRSYVRMARYGLYCAGVLSALKLLNEHVYELNYCDGPSMFPTMRLRGTFVLISKLHKYGRGIEVGDVVVYSQPQLSRVRSVKRVVGMPRDYVLVDLPTEDSENANEEWDMAQIPEGHIWVTGDNLPWSRDSREYGAVPMGLVNGKVLGHFTPFSTGYQRLENPLQQAPIASP